MSQPSINDQTAIAGIGWTAFSKASGTSVLNLSVEASLNAIADAGLTVDDIDGVLNYQYNTTDSIYPRELSYAMGMKNCNFQILDAHGGTSACSLIATAAMAIYAGLCKNVLVFRSLNGRSERRSRRGRAYLKAPVSGTCRSGARMPPQSSARSTRRIWPVTVRRRKISPTSP